MRTPVVSMICALTDPGGVIGLKGTKPWHVSRDLKRFKKLTTPSAVVMGPKTFLSIGHMLPGRLNIVITSNRDYRPANEVLVAHDPQQALDLAAVRNYTELFVIGGSMVFTSFMPLSQHLFVTYVQYEGKGDVRFPHWDKSKWHEVFREAQWQQSEKDTHPTQFAEYGRLAKPMPASTQTKWKIPDETQK